MSDQPSPSQIVRDMARLNPLKDEAANALLLCADAFDREAHRETDDPCRRLLYDMLATIPDEDGRAFVQSYLDRLTDGVMLTPPVAPHASPEGDPRAALAQLRKANDHARAFVAPSSDAIDALDLAPQREAQQAEQIKRAFLAGITVQRWRNGDGALMYVATTNSRVFASPEDAYTAWVEDPSS